MSKGNQNNDSELNDVWDFVEKYYPNYSSCQLIAESNDLSRIIEDDDLVFHHVHGIQAQLIYPLETREQTLARAMVKLRSDIFHVDALIHIKAIKGYIDHLKQQKDA